MIPLELSTSTRPSLVNAVSADDEAVEAVSLRSLQRRLLRRVDHYSHRQWGVQDDDSVIDSPETIMTHGRLLQQDTAESNCLWCAKALVRRVAGGYCRLQGPALRQEGGGFSRCERILKHPQLRQDSPQAPAVPSPGPGRARTVAWRRLPGRGGRRRGRDARRWRHHDCSVGRSGRHSIGPQCAESDDIVASVYRFCRELSCQRKWARRRSRTWCGRPTTRRGCGSAAARGAAGGQPVKASSPRPSLSRPTVPPHRASATTTAETMGTTRWMRSECALDTVQLPWLPVSPTSAHPTAAHARGAAPAATCGRGVHAWPRTTPPRQRPTTPASPRAAKTPWAPLQGTHYVRPHLPGPVLQRHRKDSPVSSCKLQVVADIFYFFRFLMLLSKKYIQYHSPIFFVGYASVKRRRRK